MLESFLIFIGRCHGDKTLLSGLYCHLSPSFNLFFSLLILLQNKGLRKPTSTAVLWHTVIKCHCAPIVSQVPCNLLEKKNSQESPFLNGTFEMYYHDFCCCCCCCCSAMMALSFFSLKYTIKFWCLHFLLNIKEEGLTLDIWSWVLCAETEVLKRSCGQSWVVHAWAVKSYYLHCYSWFMDEMWH